MATCSRPRRRVLDPVDFEAALESAEDDSSDGDELFDTNSSENEDISDGAESEEIEEPQRKRSRGRPNPKTADFAWVDGEFSPTMFPFTPVIQGIKPNVPIGEYSSELDAFLLIFDDNFLVHIVEETNNFFAFLAAHSEVKDKSKLKQWADTTTEEMYVFFATLILMGHIKKLAINDYWSTDPLVSTPSFGKIMGSERFLLLLRMIHFSSSTNQIAGDKLHKIRPIVDMLKSSFAAILAPYKDLCIDESLMLWKGRLSFRQYIPSKRHRFGIKLFVLCDCQTGYVLDFLVYTGKSTDLLEVQKDIGVSGAIVITLCNPYLSKGHNLFTDNWYTSPSLSKVLHQKQTGHCGTVKPNRHGFPKNFSQKMTKGACEEKHTDSILAVKWQDKRTVHMLTTINEPGKSASGKIDRSTNVEIEKPNCILEYNKKMGLVDKSDMQISFSEFQRKTVKWYKKFFFHLMDISLYNAYIIYKLATNTTPQLSEFRLEVVRQILGRFHVPRKSPKGGRPSQKESPFRLTERHFPEIVPGTEMKENATRRCHVCAKTNLHPRKRKESRYMCKECDVGLCVHPCFKLYHTQNEF